MWRNEASDQRNILVRKVRDIVLLAVLGIAMLISVALSAIAALATGRVLGALGYPDNIGLEWAVRVGALVFAISGSTVLFAVMFVGLCGTRVPRAALVRGTVLAAAAFEALKMCATLLLGHTMRNPVYATFSVAVGLLVWINFVSQVTLFAGAWTATAQREPKPQQEVALSAVPRGVGSGA
jgi:membrane protein